MSTLSRFVFVPAIVLLATPVMIGEMILGRRGRMSAPNTMKKIATEVGASPRWEYLGWLGIVVVFFVLSFFSVVAMVVVDFAVVVITIIVAVVVVVPQLWRKKLIIFNRCLGVF